MKNPIIVAGASSGLGLALVQRLLEQQQPVLAISRRIMPITHSLLIHQAVDLSNGEVVSDVCQQLAKQSYSGLVYCAGRGIFGGLEQLNPQHFAPLMQLNCLSAMQFTKAVVPQLKQRRAGKLIYIGSEAALQGAKQGSLYCATKFALRGFVQSLAAECTPHHIAVSLVNPGMMATDFYKDCHFQPKDESGARLAIDVVVDQLCLLINQSQPGYMPEINCLPFKKVVEKKTIQC